MQKKYYPPISQILHVRLQNVLAASEVNFTDSQDNEDIIENTYTF